MGSETTNPHIRTLSLLALQGEVLGLANGDQIGAARKVVAAGSRDGNGLVMGLRRIEQVLVIKGHILRVQPFCHRSMDGIGRLRRHNGVHETLLSRVLLHFVCSGRNESNGMRVESAGHLYRRRGYGEGEDDHSLISRMLHHYPTALRATVQGTSQGARVFVCRSRLLLVLDSGCRPSRNVPPLLAGFKQAPAMKRSKRPGSGLLSR